VADQIAARAIDLIDIGEKRSESWEGIPAIR
jgi:4-hydroxy-3-polyprenylbenzoate decarboxylase